MRQTRKTAHFLSDGVEVDFCPQKTKPSSPSLSPFVFLSTHFPTDRSVNTFLPRSPRSLFPPFTTAACLFTIHIPLRRWHSRRRWRNRISMIKWRSGGAHSATAARSSASPSAPPPNPFWQERRPTPRQCDDEAHSPPQPSRTPPPPHMTSSRVAVSTRPHLNYGNSIDRASEGERGSSEASSSSPFESLHFSSSSSRSKTSVSAAAANPRTTNED